MCNTKINMVTPTKSKSYYGRSPPQQPQNGGHHYNQHSKQQQPRSPPRGSNKSPTSTQDGFKTPKSVKADIMMTQRCASEPMRVMNKSRRSVTPKSPASSSPLNFAGPKCLEPPTPTSLPRPPTTWTRTDSSSFNSARQALSFEDLVSTDLQQKKQLETIDDPLSQQLKMLLKVQA